MERNVTSDDEGSQERKRGPNFLSGEHSSLDRWQSGGCWRQNVIIHIDLVPLDLRLRRIFS